ncbi:MAG: hypothetical protein WC326_06650 [Candidatus Delongbacteria bacterium]
MERRRQLDAQMRQLKRELPARPWLFARLAGLLLAGGRRREALALLRKGTREHEDYLSGWLVLAEALDQEGEEREAAGIRERICRQVPGIHAAWLQRLQAARPDPERHLELLRRVWDLDQFSPQRNQEMEQAGLRRPSEYEQALRPTAAEAARREEQFRRLLEQHVKPAGDGSAEVPAPDLLEPAPQAPVPSEPEPVESAPPESGLPEPERPEEIVDAILEEEDEADGSEPGELPPPRAGREQELLEQAERLEGLTRPLHLPHGLPEDANRRVTGRAKDLFDARSMMTRRLARIYLEQGYPGLAARVLEELARREPAALDLPELLETVRAEERRLAESPAPRARRKT